MADPAIEVIDAFKAFGGNHVLHGLSVTIRQGESFALIGGSGSGKSVAVKCILGLMPLDSGRILLNGRDVSERGGIDYSRIGVLFQDGALFDSMPVWQNIAFRLLRGNGRQPPAKAKAAAEERLRRVGLSTEVADLYPSELSGGMRKRVGLARAIAADPEIIFFDEPTSGLDPIRASIINELIREIVSESQGTAVMITHDMHSVRKVADRAALLHNGRIAWIGGSEALASADNPHLRQFVEGSSSGPMRLEN